MLTGLPNTAGQARPAFAIDIAGAPDVPRAFKV
jgi:hypothetical protein